MKWLGNTDIRRLVVSLSSLSSLSSLGENLHRFKSLEFLYIATPVVFLPRHAEETILVGPTDFRRYERPKTDKEQKVRTRRRLRLMECRKEIGSKACEITCFGFQLLRNEIANTPLAFLLEDDGTFSRAENNNS